MEAFRQTTLWEFATKEINPLRLVDKYGNAQAYETAVNRLVKFTGKEITMDKIDYSIISDFDQQLKTERIKHQCYFCLFKSNQNTFKQGKQKKAHTESALPFNSFRIKNEKTVSRALIKSDLDKKNLESFLKAQRCGIAEIYFF